MRDVKKKISTFCFPCTKVSDIMEKVPSILSEHSSVKDSVVHVGYNDISSQSSRLLKHDFIPLFYSLVVRSKQIFYLWSQTPTLLWHGLS